MKTTSLAGLVGGLRPMLDVVFMMGVDGRMGAILAFS